MKTKGHGGKSIFPGNSHLLSDPDNAPAFMDQLHSVKPLHLVSSILQITLGISVVLISMLDLIQYRWISTLMVMLGSITTMVGLFLFYSAAVKKPSEKGIVRDAIRRIMNAHN